MVAGEWVGVAWAVGRLQSVKRQASLTVASGGEVWAALGVWEVILSVHSGWRGEVPPTRASDHRVGV